MLSSNSERSIAQICSNSWNPIPSHVTRSKSSSTSVCMFTVLVSTYTVVLLRAEYSNVVWHSSTAPIVAALA